MKKLLFLSAFCILLLNSAYSQSKTNDERMAWWREARFGLFIHWGVYAVPAGTYNGQRINGIGECIMNRGKIPVDVYKQLPAQSRPAHYDPDVLARVADVSVV